MSMAAVVFFCLATGAALGFLYLAFSVLGALLDAGKLLTAFLDVIFCCLCGAAVFLCALAVGKGRLRAIQALFQLLGGWAVLTVFGPFVQTLTRYLKKIFWKLSALSGRFKAFLTAHFHVRRGKTAKKRGKTAKRPKKSAKKT